MIQKVLIANRGEIAVRIIRACKELDIETVAIYSKADEFALHVQMADEAYCVGNNFPKDSYLNQINIIETAMKTGCQAIHPGYGFLAENADFAELCKTCNLIFIGPTHETIAKMGLKDVAREQMKKANVPVVPGSLGIIANVDEALITAKEIGYPVIIKATAGGGGKGIRIAKSPEELINNLQITQQEASASFGNAGVYLEKYISTFRHIEIQILADNYGNVIHLGERDCSIQRRLQKLVEEAPSSIIDANMRKSMGEAAVNAARFVNYTGAGTIEFIFDTVEKKFYFMEMNTRIQVEHPVTEMITGIDLIKEQIRIANGERLTIKQEDVRFSGWAIECRVNAENPEKNFMPSAGEISMYLAPGGNGVRVDSAAFPGYQIPPYYDSMIAKLIVYGTTRKEAIAKMRRALSEFVINGVNTTIPFHQRLMENKDFIADNYTTNFLDKVDIMSS